MHGERKLEKDDINAAILSITFLQSRGPHGMTMRPKAAQK